MREVQTLLQPARIEQGDDEVVVHKPKTTNDVDRLVYFATASSKRAQPVFTQQHTLERVNGNGVGRQSTRYSVHGLHEYKGKFNPQVAKALLNIFGVRSGQTVLDPFCGSGTSLVECAHLGIDALGADINPMAVFIANAKLNSLAIPANKLYEAARSVVEAAKKSKRSAVVADLRGEYLSQWFTKKAQCEIERLRWTIEGRSEEEAQILLALASNLLRDYSLQDPHDLRIRRRKSPPPVVPFLDAFEKAARAYTDRLADGQLVLGVKRPGAKAIEADSRQLRRFVHGRKFDAAITSPPYATALPYIDTQRLSLVWLGLVDPAQILTLESSLVGSREVRGESKKALLNALQANEANLPEQEAKLCMRLQSALTDQDGFRRQGVPRLLYRYFSGMMRTFIEVHALMKLGAPFGLIVGGNHTVLGGRRIDIDTPQHLASLAVATGWQHVETVPLQTYQRFGLHMVNATTSEALLILRA